MVLRAAREIVLYIVETESKDFRFTTRIFKPIPEASIRFLSVSFVQILYVVVLLTC